MFYFFSIQDPKLNSIRRHKIMDHMFPGVVLPAYISKTIKKQNNNRN